MSDNVLIETLYLDWDDGDTKDTESNQLSPSYVPDDTDDTEKENTDICGVYEVVVIGCAADASNPQMENVDVALDDATADTSIPFPQVSENTSVFSKKNDAEETSSPVECLSMVEGIEKSSKMIKKNPIKSKSKSDTVRNKKNVCANIKSSAKVQDVVKTEVKRKLPRGVPSVYSCSQIKKHKTRLELKALEENTDSDSDNNMCDGKDEPDADPNLDINLRIFEESVKSIENVIIGEIQCDVMDDKGNSEQITEKTNNKNTSVFKLSVNANFSETNKQKSEIIDNSKHRTDIVNEEADILSDLSSDYLFSDDDSDLDILTSKPIVRKKAAQLMKKEKKKERTESDRKLTMYDLIYDTVLLSPRNKEECCDVEQKLHVEKNDPKKVKSAEEKAKLNKMKSVNEKKDSKKSKSAEEKTKLNESEGISDDKASESSKVEVKTDSDVLPVPQLKVGADGQVIIDMDSLVIEQTGLEKARNAIANSEIIEECELNYMSYNKKCDYRKQWSPHDTLKFYDVLSAIGTDFTLMATLFPGRTRNCMKRKFKREEKTNADLILKALTCKQKFDIGLLEKELKKKEEMVKLLKKNSTKESKKQKNKGEAKGTKKIVAKSKRKSFFERGISCFQKS